LITPWNPDRIGIKKTTLVLFPREGSTNGCGTTTMLEKTATVAAWVKRKKIRLAAKGVVRYIAWWSASMLYSW
jgi:hypothetical protein